MTVDAWKGTLKCTVSRASHDETCSLGANGICSSVDSVEFVETATCQCVLVSIIMFSYIRMK